ncbi:YhcN/YlaJ family sporulation lipoprotein [Sporolactobacillus sp. CPB3-1]|uniref:YhcN/YlaJ family sporulation lipoprotein n=1 Tax=Sporolactobacillus mangiferae TaxID=2940498 RepID=A0ABT0M6L0_9BACL|nr:YhcN/YlaJ family sporulation lipoprotein [Sporolactobacillus mangiferae]MCL1630500.1 YhcN/YlaJ family sporulation lipoprotein [Sporolactobacillus mangiferae]
MKKAMIKLGTVLSLSALLAGCQAGPNNAAYQRPNAPRDVTYRTNNTNPNVPDYTNLNDNNANTNQINQVSDKDQRKLAKRIADRAASVDGVDKAHVLVTGNSVAIGAVPDKGQTDRANLRKKIRLSVLPLAGNREVLVSTDNRYVKRITAAETPINAGKATQEVRSDVVGIINDLANAVKRPFQNNSK